MSKETIQQQFPEESAERIPELMKEVLDAHIVDIEPGAGGKRELVKSMGNASLGAREVSVDRPIPALRIKSATLRPGESKVLIGPNGAGKSTFFDAFMDRGAHIGSEHGAAMVGKSVHAREKLRIARLDQEELLDKLNKFTCNEVLENTSEYFKAQFPIDWENADLIEENIENQKVHARIETFKSKVLRLFDMNDFLDTRVEHLSGGERTKVALCIVLLSEPDVLFLDEPTNHLDLQSISKLTALFEQYNRAGVAILSASHVPWFLNDASKDGVLDISWGKGERVLNESKSPYDRFIKNRSRGVVPMIQGEIGWQQADYEHKRGQTVIDFPETFTIPDSPLKNVSLPSIQGGNLVVISGNNGTGKTKLMETLVFNRRDELPKKQKGVQIAYLPQFWPEAIARGTLGDFFSWVKDTATPHEKGSAYHPESPASKLFIKRARELEFGGKSKNIGESWLRQPFKNFSGGEQRLLWFLAASTLRNLDMIVLDEPTNHMDQFSQKKVLRTIQTFPGAVVLSSHDRDLMHSLSDGGGATLGQVRYPVHVVLEKRKGVTTAKKTDESLKEYTDRIIREVKSKTRNIRV